jgi:hypothetical protein
VTLVTPVPGTPPTVRVLAIDPGGTTAGALFAKVPSALEGEYVEYFSTWAETDRECALRRCHSELDLGLDALVVEDYRISGARAKEANETIEIIGALDWLCRQYWIPLVRQEPGAGQAFAGKRWEKLHRMGWYKPGPDHERSAAGHLLLYLVRESLVSASRVLESESMEGDN